MSKREERESDSYMKDKSSSYFASDSEESSSFIPYTLIINKVKNRLLSLSPTVRTGLERECNKDDFYREGDSYIGKGAFGEVWKVSHKMTGKIYVIKVIDKMAIKGERLIDQINREIEIMYKLNHPHVIKLINHFEDDEKFYLIMPYASKGQLYSLLKRQVRFDQRTAAQYMREVIEAVRYIHSFSPKIIHRDIKPENLLLDENYRVLLSDFGWSNFLADDEFRKTFCGTPEYLSPEMVKKEGHNEMVDIWALGVLMFELLAGYAPFTGSCPKELYTNIKKLKINWPVDFPPLAKNLITKILKLNPNERLSLEEILDHSWFTQNPPLRHVLKNYLTNEKDILKSHLIIEKPENVEDKLNVITDKQKRKFLTLKMQLMNSNNINNNKNDEKNNEKSDNSDNDEENLTSENKENDNTNNNTNNNVNYNKINNNMNMNNRMHGMNNLYMGNINENFIILKKQLKILQKNYEELSLKESKENKLIKILKEENEKLKKNQENLKNNNITLIEQEIKKYKLLSENREELLKNIDELNFKNNELTLQNEIMKNKISQFELQMNNLNDKINELKKENEKYIEEISQIKQGEKILQINIEEKNNDNDSNNNEELVNKLNEFTEKNIKSLIDNISPLNLELTNFEQKINDSINNNVLSFLNEKMKYFDNLLKEENQLIKINDNTNNFFEQNKKLIEELKEEKKKNELKNNLNKTENEKNKMEILEERIKNLLEEKKVNNELMELKNKEIEKAKTKIKNMEDKIYDINEFIKNKCKNEAFIKKIHSICNLDNFK